MKPKPRGLGPEFGRQFDDASIVAAYGTRPPYPEPLLRLILDIAGPAPHHLLDLGCGTGELARRLALPGPFTAAMAAESFHWFDWARVSSRVAEWVPSARLVLVEGRVEEPTPWAHDLTVLVARYSTNREFEPYRLVDELRRSRLRCGRAGAHRASRPWRLSLTGDRDACGLGQGIGCCPRRDLTDDGGGALEAVIELTRGILAASLEGLDAFSHAEVVFPSSTACRRMPRCLGPDIPEGIRNGRRSDLRAAREGSANRIGTTIVRVVRREGARLSVRGLDAWTVRRWWTSSPCWRSSSARSRHATGAGAGTDHPRAGTVMIPSCAAASSWGRRSPSRRASLDNAICRPRTQCR
jgi:hypothetical protein